jgi:hypothetical protein
MEGIEKPHTDKYKEITNNWNYDASCTAASLPVWDLENFQRLIFVVQSVPLAVRERMWFMYDDAPPHFILARNHLSNAYDNR